MEGSTKINGGYDDINGREYELYSKDDYEKYIYRYEELMNINKINIGIIGDQNNTAANLIHKVLNGKYTKDDVKVNLPDKTIDNVDFEFIGGNKKYDA